MDRKDTKGYINPKERGVRGVEVLIEEDLFEIIDVVDTKFWESIWWRIPGERVENTYS